MGLFPYVTKSAFSIAPDSSGDINSGVVGALLARQECVNGEYPLTDAFLDLLLACVTKSSDNADAVTVHPATTSVLYVIQDVLPVFQQWRFSHPGAKERLGQKVLRLGDAILSNGATGSLAALKKLVASKLLSPAPCR